LALFRDHHLVFSLIFLFLAVSMKPLTAATTESISSLPPGFPDGPHVFSLTIPLPVLLRTRGGVALFLS